MIPEGLPSEEYEKLEAQVDQLIKEIAKLPAGKQRREIAKKINKLHLELNKGGAKRISD